MPRSPVFCSVKNIVLKEEFRSPNPNNSKHQTHSTTVFDTLCIDSIIAVHTKKFFVRLFLFILIVISPIFFPHSYWERFRTLGEEFLMTSLREATCERESKTQRKDAF